MGIYANPLDLIYQSDKQSRKKTEVIQGYFPEGKMKEIPGKDVTELNQPWPMIVTYLENIHCKVEIIKNLIPGGIAQSIPHIDPFI